MDLAKCEGIFQMGDLRLSSTVEQFDWQGTVNTTSASTEGEEWAQHREETPAAHC